MREEPFDAFTLTSKDSISAIQLDDTFSSQFFLLIENQDNPSLKIDSVRGYYRPYYMKAYLESDKIYTINIGRADLPNPVYDLSNFDDRADDHLETLKPAPLTEKRAVIETTAEPFFKNKLWVGAGLLFVAVILAYACFQMVRDLKR